ncbi:hypothetical protein DAEQUDRAFT_320505 [Daedalea quercina L-15889]|uniref:Uncharacterized protein n=1 Tax=Daedalea quercina L-15889 TaxID=1314783 RepID=A0A165PRU6_9APHY|nr:hypothetical protein DAEQUDRAFT_320505 [Daedalea quercina L-15889]
MAAPRAQSGVAHGRHVLRSAEAILEFKFVTRRPRGYCPANFRYMALFRCERTVHSLVLPAIWEILLPRRIFGCFPCRATLIVVYATQGHILSLHKSAEVSDP